jgi:hypothetical protein
MARIMDCMAMKMFWYTSLMYELKQIPVHEHLEPRVCRSWQCLRFHIRMSSLSPVKIPSADTDTETFLLTYALSSSIN